MDTPNRRLLSEGRVFEWFCLVWSIATTLRVHDSVSNDRPNRMVL